MNLIRHSSREAAARAVAARLAAALAARLAQAPAATLALPGGTSPAPVMAALSALPLDWARVTVLPGDERLVAADHPRSNYGLIRRHLLHGPAAAARLLPLTAAADLAALLPLAANLMGMGEDGHVASLFPAAPGLAAALAPEAPPVVAMQAPDGEARLSLSAPVLRGADLVTIFILGAGKRAVIEAAAGADPQRLPVAAFLDRAEVHWAE